MVKEAVELFTLTLTSSDPCVWLGRDRALLSVEENGGKGNPVSNKASTNHSQMIDNFVY